MLRRRGTPAFIELLPGVDAGRAVPVTAPPKPVVRVLPVARAAGATGAPASAAAVVPPTPGRPQRTYDASGSPVATPETSGAASPATAARPDLRVWLYAAAAGVVVASLLWVIAFKVGESSGRREGDERVRRLVQGEANGKGGVGTVAADPLTRPLPANPGPASTSAAMQVPPSAPVNPVPEAAPPAPKPVAVAPGAAVSGFQPGLNYLVVATLRRSDADEAAKYLASQGLPIYIVPERGVDPASPQANNGSWEVLVLQGYSSPLSASQAERDALEARVKTLGRRWKAENKRAPTDFAQVFWKRFKGP